MFCFVVLKKKGGDVVITYVASTGVKGIGRVITRSERVNTLYRDFIFRYK